MDKEAAKTTAIIIFGAIASFYGLKLLQDISEYAPYLIIIPFVVYSIYRLLVYFNAKDKKGLTSNKLCGKAKTSNK